MYDLEKFHSIDRVALFQNLNFVIVPTFKVFPSMFKLKLMLLIGQPSRVCLSVYLIIYSFIALVCSFVCPNIPLF